MFQGLKFIEQPTNNVRKNDQYFFGHEKTIPQHVDKIYSKRTKTVLVLQVFLRTKI